MQAENGNGLCPNAMCFTRITIQERGEVCRNQSVCYGTKKINQRLLEGNVKFPSE
jgi:hypothetical protein